MNVLVVGVTNTVHYTEAAITDPNLGQRRNRTVCSARQVTGYVVAAEGRTVNCPRCIAKV